MMGLQMFVALFVLGSIVEERLPVNVALVQHGEAAREGDGLGTQPGGYLDRYGLKKVMRIPDGMSEVVLNIRWCDFRPCRCC